MRDAARIEVRDATLREIFVALAKRTESLGNSSNDHEVAA
jgi:hypothetical protein